MNDRRKPMDGLADMIALLRDKKFTMTGGSEFALEVVQALCESDCCSAPLAVGGVPPTQVIDWPRNNPWALAVDQAMVEAGLDCTVATDDPARTVAKLIEWTRTVALDPAVSSEAQALVERGRSQPAQVGEWVKEAERLTRVLRIAVTKQAVFPSGPAVAAVERADAALLAHIRTRPAEDAAAPQESSQAVEVLREMVAIIDAAGLMNLSNGVQLGQTAWYVKACDALDRARSLVAGLGDAK